MVKFFTKLLASYDYKSFEDFLYSLFPSFKYHLQTLMMVLAVISGVFDHFFGIRSGLAVAMFFAVAIEIWTGIRASRKEGKNFESFRFSRCFIKIAVWFVILYIIHQFKNEFIDREGLINYFTLSFFEFCFTAVLTGFFVEYIVSILENKAVMDGKPKTEIVGAIKNTWTSFLELIKPQKK